MRETRREFLRKVVLLGEVVFFGGLISGEADHLSAVDGTFGARFDQDPVLSFAEAREIAVRVSGLYEKLPAYDQEITLTWLNSLVARFVPIMVEVGVIRESVYPSIKVVHFTEAYDWENAWARTEDCGPVLEFSDRLFDPADPWSRQPARAMATVAHEGVHPQQGGKLCIASAFSGTKLRLESSADIASMEVMSYSLFHGFPEGVFGLMARLRESALATALILAAIEGKSMEGRRLVDRLALNRFEREKLANDFNDAILAVRASRGGHGRGDLSEIAESLPISLVVTGIRENQGMVEGLMLSPIGGYKEPKTESSGVQGPFGLPNLTRFLFNAEAIVAGKG